MKNLINIIFSLLLTSLFVSCDSKNKIAVQENDLRRYEDSAASFVKWLIKNDSSKLFMRVLNDNNPDAIKYHKVLSSKLAQYTRPLNMLTDYKIINDSLCFSTIDTNLVKDVLLNINRINFIDSNLNKLGITILDENNLEKEDLELNSFTKLSTPIFSADYNMVIFEVNLICQPQCGYGTEYIYKKTQNAWKMIDRRDTWIN